MERVSTQRVLPPEVVILNTFDPFRWMIVMTMVPNSKWFSQQLTGM